MSAFIYLLLRIRTDIQKIKVYPNPVQSTAFIDLKSQTEIDHVEILNVLGEKVGEKQLMTNISEIDLSNLCPGMYFLKLKNSIDGEYLLNKIYKE